jgi:hypothetical protein
MTSAGEAINIGENGLGLEWACASMRCVGFSLASPSPRL